MMKKDYDFLALYDDEIINDYTDDDRNYFTKFDKRSIGEDKYLLDKGKALIDSYKKLAENKDKLNIKVIIMNILKQLGYDEIANNEVILYHLSMMYRKNNEDYLESIEEVYEMGDRYVKELSSELYDTIYNFIKDRFRYSKTSDEIILESDYIECYQNIHGYTNFNFSCNPVDFINQLLNRHVDSWDMKIDKLIYNFKTSKTTFASHNIATYVKIKSSKYDHFIQFNSTSKIYEYDNNAKMIKYEDITNAPVLRYDDYCNTGYYGSFENLIASGKNFETYLSIAPISNKEAEVTSIDNANQELYTVKNKVDLVYANNYINYFNGNVYSISEDDEELHNELGSYGTLDYYYQKFLLEVQESRISNDEINQMMNELKAKYKPLENNMISSIFEFDLNKMIPYDLENQRIKVMVESGYDINKGSNPTYL